MTEYLITFNDEWVPDHTAEELRGKSTAVRSEVPGRSGVTAPRGIERGP